MKPSKSSKGLSTTVSCISGKGDESWKLSQDCARAGEGLSSFHESVIGGGDGLCDPFSTADAAEINPFRDASLGGEDSAGARGGGKLGGKTEAGGRIEDFRGRYSRGRGDIDISDREL
jgi:hypothetical protein